LLESGERWIHLRFPVITDDDDDVYTNLEIYKYGIDGEESFWLQVKER
jgi:hypothetical protein